MYKPFECDSSVGRQYAGYAAVPDERHRLAQALQTLTDIPFKESICRDGPMCVYTGKVSVSQMDRLNYVARECGIIVPPLRIPGDAASKDIYQIRVESCGNLPTLEKLAAQEKERRQSEAEAADVLTEFTKYPFGWDGLTISTMLPLRDSPQAISLNQKLALLKQHGAIVGENGLAVFPTETPDGRKTHWLTAHALDVSKLHSLHQSLGEQKGMSL